MVSSLADASVRQIADILRAHGVVHAAFFGSFARGTATEQSDVDLLVEFGQPTSLLEMADLELELGDLLGRSVEIVTYAALNARIRGQVLREQVVIL
ncbi:MAG TPA: nucleotidyltransferase domain-containing protein [Ktedonobacterales bacterium]|nr:nucleotidyltransferase domain-containing protein [Ktedonobacterales bacterium]